MQVMMGNRIINISESEARRMWSNSQFFISFATKQMNEWFGGVSPQAFDNLKAGLRAGRQALEGFAFGSPGDERDAYWWYNNCIHHLDKLRNQILGKAEPPFQPTPPPPRAASPKRPSPQEIAAQQARERATQESRAAEARARDREWAESELARAKAALPTAEAEDKPGLRVTLSDEERAECLVVADGLMAVAEELARGGSREAAVGALEAAKELGKIAALAGVSAALPPVDLVVSAVELVTGRDVLTGTELSNLQRIMAIVSLLTLGTLGTVKGAMRVAAKLAVRPDKLGNWARRILIRLKATDVGMRADWKITKVYDVWHGSDIPRTYDLRIGNQVIKVKPNASKHIWEYEESRRLKIGAGAGRYSELAVAVEEGLKTPLTTFGRNDRHVDRWELTFEKMEDGSIELFHALYASGGK